MTALPAWATTVRKMELPELVSNSECIVQGRVEQVYTEWDAARRMVFTYASINIDDPLKGERRRTVLVRQVGGTIGALNMVVAGAPKFEKGDEVIVFLKTGAGGTYHVVGLNQGKYDITGDYAVANVSGVTVVDPKTGKTSDAGFVEKAPVEAFKSRIRELLR
jgi:hypothetical protein